ncbi:MAG: flagellar basal body L-ring protein FlgH [Acidobacteria bacterium]|nr:flagellar basal body L-ring protein FlgH [Acidobacteriota bacterium]
MMPKAAVLFLASMLMTLAACRPKSVSSEAVTALGNYVTEAKSDSRAAPSAEGSLWVRHGRRSDLVRDFKARDVNDVVTVRVIESTVANASAGSKTSKDSSISAGFPNLLGFEKKIKELPNLIDGKSSSSFEGAGSTSRSSSLRTSVTARVIDVLPNGYLVIQGVREVRLNNESQTVTITGVVRPEDITPANEVLSSDVAQMSVRVQGKGLVSQPISPGWLYRILSGIMPF